MVLLSTNKVCAVVVPESVQKCHDILPASSNLVECTRCPFGLNIYAWEENQPSQPSLQNLIYVSEQAASDRAPEKNVMNGMGVYPGWYVIARPGRFKVHVSHVNTDHYGLPWEDGLQLCLEVDGQNVNKRYLLNQKKIRTFMAEWAFEGFVDKDTTSCTSNKYEELLRPFAFERLSNIEESKEIERTDVGTITLKVSAGILQRLDYPVHGQIYSYTGQQVGKKAIAREGRTMRVSRMCPPVSRIMQHSKNKLTNLRSLLEAEVIIHVRERSWLCSRRLIDEQDRPITYGVFRKLLQASKPPVRHPVCNEVVTVDEEPVRKRPKIKKQIVLYEDVKRVQPGEVIDLT